MVAFSILKEQQILCWGYEASEIKGGSSHRRSPAGALIWDTTFFFVNCQRRSIPNILPSYILKYVYHFSARSYRQPATEKTPNLDRMIQAMIVTCSNASNSLCRTWSKIYRLKRIHSCPQKRVKIDLFLFISFKRGKGRKREREWLDFLIPLGEATLNSFSSRTVPPALSSVLQGQKGWEGNHQPPLLELLFSACWRRAKQEGGQALQPGCRDWSWYVDLQATLFSTLQSKGYKG